MDAVLTVGEPRYNESGTLIEGILTWAERIQASGATEAWVYFNNDRDGFAVKNALTFRRLLRSMPTGALADKIILSRPIPGTVR